MTEAAGGAAMPAAPTVYSGVVETLEQFHTKSDLKAAYIYFKRVTMFSWMLTTYHKIREPQPSSV